MREDELSRKSNLAGEVGQRVRDFELQQERIRIKMKEQAYQDYLAKATSRCWGSQSSAIPWWERPCWG